MIKLDGKKVRFLAQDRKYVTDPYPAVAPLDSTNNIFVTGQHYEADDKDRQGFLTQAEITGELEIKPAGRLKKFSPKIDETTTVLIIHNKEYDCTVSEAGNPNNPKDYWDAHFIIAQDYLVAKSKTKATIKHKFYMDDKDEEAKHFVVTADAKYEAEKLIREQASIDEYKDIIMLLNLSVKDFHVDWRPLTSTRLKEVLLKQADSNPSSIKFAFTDQGKDVLFMMDSVTRYAMAEREIGLAIGEPPTTKGYTPSVFAKLPKLLERAGTTLDKGTITALYTVLVEADDMNDPIADSVRAILDGHIVLSRELAVRNHYPSIEIAHSISRLMIDVTKPEHRQAAGRFKETLAIYNDARDLIDIGAYTPGSNPKIDYAVEHIDAMNSYLRQQIEERADFGDSVSELASLLPE